MHYSWAPDNTRTRTASVDHFGVRDKIRAWPRGVAVNMPPCHGGDRRFESDRGRQIARLNRRVLRPAVLRCFGCLRSPALVVQPLSRLRIPVAGQGTGAVRLEEKGCLVVAFIRLDYVPGRVDFTIDLPIAGYRASGILCRHERIGAADATDRSPTHDLQHGEGVRRP